MVLKISVPVDQAAEIVEYFAGDLGKWQRAVHEVDSEFGGENADCWGDVTIEPPYPGHRVVFSGNWESALGEYRRLRQSGARGYVSITTTDYHTFYLALPAVCEAGDTQ